MADMERIERILDRQFRMTDMGRIDRIRDLFTTFNPRVDLEALKNSPFFPALEEMMEPVLDVRDERSPEVLAYWAKRGMVKEFHGDNDPMSWTEYEQKTGYRWVCPHVGATQNFVKKWTSFVPVSAFRSENRGRRYPTVVALHGGFNPVGLIDGWGFVQEAARREWIVIVPSVELDDVLEEILDKAEECFPIDRSRIYCLGFSYGGFMANTLGNKRPETYAAVAVCGAPMSNGYAEKAIGPEPQLPFDGRSRAKELGVYMPIINVIGDLDGGCYPLYDYGETTETPWHMDRLDPQMILDGINHWADVNDAVKVTMEQVSALKGSSTCSPAERQIGIPLGDGCGKVLSADGVTNYIADLPSRDGIVRTRLMVEANIPHWPTPELSRQAFRFFSRFSRDPETKESVFHPEVEA